MKKFLTFCLVAMLPFMMYAQEDATKKGNKDNSGVVKIHQDSEIDQLLGGSGSKDSKGTEAKSEGQKPTTNASSSKGSSSTAKSSGKTQTATNGKGTAHVELSKDNGDGITDHRKFIDGYRIQIAARGNTNNDHVAVKAIGKKFKGYFRDWRVEVYHISPRWVCYAGDFRTREEAQVALKKVQNTHRFNGACIVRAKIKNSAYTGSR